MNYDLFVKNEKRGASSLRYATLNEDERGFNNYEQQELDCTETGSKDFDPCNY
jgi:hypothetical protein